MEASDGSNVSTVQPLAAALSTWKHKQVRDNALIGPARVCLLWGACFTDLQHPVTASAI